MIEFRQKTFNNKILTSIKKGANPITITSLGISSLSLANNIKRRKQDKKYQTAQIQATEELAKAINEELDRKSTKKATRKFKRSVKNTIKAKNSNPILNDIIN